jgi:hypothetical protein
MRNGEWTLAYGAESVTFGLLDTEAVLTKAPDLGDAALTTADSPRARRDGVAFGQDFRGGRTVTFDLGIVRPSEAEALAAVERFSRLWRADEVRSTPGATATLTVRRAGRERVLFGRPRRFAENVEHIEEGYATILADFAASDDCFYSSTETATTISLVPPLSGGLMAPLASPLTTTESSDRSVGIVVGGSLPAWPVIEITGPISNPSIEIVGKWRMDFAINLAAGQTLTVDTRPWGRTIKRDGASVPGVITRSSVRLGNAALAPGAYEVAFRGLSESGTSTARFSWRDTFPTL